MYLNIMTFQLQQLLITLENISHCKFAQTNLQSRRRYASQLWFIFHGRFQDFPLGWGQITLFRDQNFWMHAYEAEKS